MRLAQDLQDQILGVILLPLGRCQVEDVLTMSAVEIILLFSSNPLEVGVYGVVHYEITSSCSKASASAWRRSSSFSSASTASPSRRPMALRATTSEGAPKAGVG